MKIQTNTDVPDYTYFTMSDVEPAYNAETDTLTIITGEGRRRSWGRPRCESTVVYRGRSVIAVHVGFSHKHRGGQGWHYFRREGSTWTKTVWGQLSDTERQRVLDRAGKAPHWAKSPGKLRNERADMQKRTAYKLVAVRDGRLVSLFDGTTEYTIGKRLAQKAVDYHGGGYYAYADVNALWSAWTKRTIVPERCLEGVDENSVALLEVEISGTIIEYGSKLAATYIKPLRVVEIPA